MLAVVATVATVAMVVVCARLRALVRALVGACVRASVGLGEVGSWWWGVDPEGAAASACGRTWGPFMRPKRVECRRGVAKQPSYSPTALPRFASSSFSTLHRLRLLAPALYTGRPAAARLALFK